MLKKLLIITSIVTISSEAYAHNLGRTYFELGAGVNFPEDRKRENSTLKRIGKESLNSFFALGYKVTNNINIQAGLDYINKNEYNQEAKANQPALLSRMSILVPKVSLYFNHTGDNKLGFYVGGSLGAAFYSSIENENVFTKQIKKLDDKTELYCSGDIGMSFNMTEKVQLGLGYSYGYYGKIVEKWDPVTIHSIKTGLKFTF